MPNLDSFIMGRTNQNGLRKRFFHLSNYSKYYDAENTELSYEKITRRIYEETLAVFPKENILLLDGDRLVANPLAELEKAEQFLKIPQFFK